MSAALSHSQAIENITSLQTSLNELILGKEEKIDLAICCLLLMRWRIMNLTKVDHQVAVPAHGKAWLYAIESSLLRPLGTLLTRDNQLLAKRALTQDFIYQNTSILYPGTFTSPGQIKVSELRMAAKPRSDKK